jgi:hypothetical protein
MVPEQSFAFFLQETDTIYSISKSRTAYNESHQIGPGQSEALQMQEIAPT